MKSILGWILLITLAVIPSNSQSYTIDVVDVGNCFGGAPCLQQPRVKIKNAQGVLAQGFVGSAYIQMGSSPTGFEVLYLGTCGLNGQCGRKISGSNNTVPFVDGYATFQNLTIKTAGVGYSLQITAIDGTGFAVASQSTSSFSVLVGPIFNLQFNIAIGGAFGGQIFSPDPQIAIVDRGGNLVTAETGVTCTAFLSKSPSMNEKLYPLIQIPTTFVAGIAKLHGLYIGPIGFPYQVTFNSSSTTGIALPTLRSGYFRVSVGPVFQLVTDSTYVISSVPILAGEYFRITPRLILLDKGGNIVTLDSTSRVNITLDINPSNAVISPLSSKSSVAIGGYVKFSVLKLNKVGQNYRFKYVLSTFSSLTRTYTDTALFLLSEYFEVKMGSPRILSIVSKADRAIAGGRAFTQQPTLQLMDLGSNIIITDSTSILTCNMVESLAAHTGVRRVDTASSTIRNHVKSVTLNVANGTYGKGELILMTVHFKYEIYYLGPAAVTPHPYLSLSLSAHTNSHLPTAALVSAYDSVTSLTFLYTVRQGDKAFSLNYASTSALKFNQSGYRFVDGNNHTVRLSLPSKGLSYHTHIVIDTTPPVVVSISTYTSDGMYGAGEEIVFNVEYNYPVEVTGSPYLTLSALSGNTSSNSSVTAYAEAIYMGMNATSSSKTLIFLYTVRYDDYTPTGQYLTVNSSSLKLPLSANIRRLTSTPSVGTPADNSLAQHTAAFALAHHLIVDRGRPALDLGYGLKTSHADGVYYPGEQIYITLRFDRPVVAVGASINIYLQTGSAQDPLNGIALLAEVLDDDVTLLFLYTVVSRTNTTNLDIISDGTALFVGGAGTYIRRKATVPTLDANISTSAVYSSGNSLGQNSNIQLYGYQPEVTKVSIISVQQAFAGQYLYPDDQVTIRLTYSTRVMSACPPVLLINAGPYTREAPLSAGNQTQYLEFVYTVETGDYSPNGLKLSYSNPPPFCATSGCSTFPKYCGVFANATNSFFAADLGLPYTVGRQSTGISIPGANYSTQPRSPTRNTSVLSITTRVSTGSYSVGTLIYIDVALNDIAVIYALPYPSLYLNIGKYAIYASGFSTNVLSFLYVSQVGDSIAALLPMNVPNTTSPIRCRAFDGCFITNAVNGYVNITVKSDVISFPAIELNGAVANITRVFSPLKTSPYEGYYTVGQVVDIYVVFSRPVIVVGTTARLQMAVGVSRYALYSSILSTSTVLAFQFVAEQGDDTSNLAYTGPSIDLSSGTSGIYNAADIPTAQANLTLPGGLNSYTVATGSNIIRLNTTTANRPRVISVFSVGSNTTYRSGDSIFLCVEYSHFIVLTGRGFLTLNLGTQTGIASFVGITEESSRLFLRNSALNTTSTSSTTSVTVPTNSTTQLYFSYTVVPGDYSSSLDYTDCFAFDPGMTDLAVRGAVLLSLNAPTDLVSPSLPTPGFSGSLSATSNLFVDSAAAYMTALFFVSPPGYYSTGDILLIEMNFSAPVVVSGVPYLILSTGSGRSKTRNSTYLSGSGSSSLLFLYVPSPGDYSTSLDYIGVPGKLNSAVSSFQLNGGSVLVASHTPSISALIILSPPSGTLSGTFSVTAKQGAFSFSDLSINTYGLDYYLRFTTSLTAAYRVLTATDTVFVSFSAQYELYPSTAQDGDRVCAATAVSGTVAVCGAPHSNYSVTPIQSVVLSVPDSAVPTPEILIFSTTLTPRPAIQQFHTTASVGETVEGFFTLMFGDLGPSFQIPANANEDMLDTLLTASIPEVGNLTVTRREYVYCACHNAFTWTITFHDFGYGVMPPIVIDYTGLTGDDAAVFGPIVLRAPASLAGSFSFQLNTTSGIEESSLIPFDATQNQVSSALSALSLVADVQRGLPALDGAGTRLWTLTFGAYKGGYKIPTLTLLTTHLTGGAAGPGVRTGTGTGMGMGVAGAWVEVIRAGVLGPGGVSGGFALEWRGNITAVMPFNVSAGGLKAALEALPVIGVVTVHRSLSREGKGGGQYKWTVEFVEVYLYTPQGFELQPPKNVEPLTAHPHFDSEDVVISVYAGSTPVLPVHPLVTNRLGSYGTNAGAVYVYTQLPTGRWQSVSLLRASDTSEGDMFGCSVAIKGKHLLIGASSGTKYGAPEIQSVFCSADKGFFSLTFRGWSTGFLGVNITVEELTASILSEPSTFSNLYSITSLTIKDWGGGGLCSNNTALITFYTPNNGYYPFFGVNNGPELELLGVVFEELQYEDGTAGVVTVSEVQKSTRILNTLDADVQQQGTAYLFTDTSNCSSSSSNISCLSGTSWTQTTTFYPLNPVGSERFGACVALESDISIIGAPGSANNSGLVYVYSYGTHGEVSNISSWVLLQRLSSVLTVSGDQFGHSVAVHGVTLVVGAPYGSGGTGAVYVFRAPKLGQPYGSEQLLVPALGYVLQHGDMYGHSVGISDNTVVVGAPLVDDTPIYLGLTASPLTQLDSGAVFVFVRTSSKYKFSALQKLVASNVKRLDRLGWAVAVCGDVIVVGAVQDPQGSLDTPPVYPIKGSISVQNNSSYTLDEEVRAKVHAFQRSLGGLFREQLLLTPSDYQPSDQCGYSVALLDEYYAFTGCPNRAGITPHTNHGGGIFFNLTLLTLKFGSYNYSVVEGRNLTLTLLRDSTHTLAVQNDILLYVQTLDRNAQPSVQLYAQQIYNIKNSDVSYPDTVLDTTGLVGNAVGRSQYYGSHKNKSSWIGGRYDYRGISDYVPFLQAMVLRRDLGSASVTLYTNSDGILERPDETVSVVISSPGLWPSILGRFHTSISLLDNTDGYANDVAQYDKVYETPAVAGNEYGHAVAVIASLGIMFSSAPLANVGTCVGCGKVFLSTHASGLWKRIAEIVSPTPSPGTFFGDDIIARYDSNRNISLLVVGEPGNNTVHVFLSQQYGLGSEYVLEASLTVSAAILPQHRFGCKGAVALAGSLLIVGAPGLEAVYAFRRLYFNSSTRVGWGWTDGELLRSSDFDYDFIDSVDTLHTMNFGKAVAVSGRTIAVGAPFADYGRLGSAFVEVNVDTQGQDIIGYGRGKVYVFSSSPAVQSITLDAIEPLSGGQFRLIYIGYGSTQTTQLLGFNATADMMVSALETLSNIDSVAVTMTQNIPILTGFRTTWTVSFVDMWATPSVLVPVWGGHGCSACASFTFNSTVPALQVQTSLFSTVGNITQDQVLTASDSRNGNRFGWSLAIDGHQLAVGAVFSAGATTTSWDFEAGVLKGWTPSGTAFSHQPTFGDNSKYRVVKRISPISSLGSSGESSRLRGNYYIGTYELRPGNSTDYSISNSRYPPGSAQGDGPQGTLTSDVFVIYGTTITLLLGGGCDYYLIYVELLVDGLSVSRLTGKCEERMRSVFFDTSFLQFRSAQIRIVDSSSGSWGHINVDEIKFNWDVRGASLNDTVNAVGDTVYNGKDTPGGLIDTPHSGAAYTFLRHITDSNNLCLFNLTSCSWQQETRLVASDKRENAMFGSSLAVNDAAGILVVGSPHTALTGFYRETPSIYPYQGLDLTFPVKSNLAPFFEGTALYSLEASGAFGYWYLQQQLLGGNTTLPTLPTEQAGAVYLYRKTPAKLTNVGTVYVPQHWPHTEFTQIQPPDSFSRDFFGGSVSLDGSLLAVGAVGQDGAGFDAGAVYMYNMQFSAASFSRLEYHVIEGTDAQATVLINRDLSVFQGALYLHYATSDLTAQGVDPLKYAVCQTLSPAARGPALCGDYQQTEGVLFIGAGVSSGAFQVNILNDLCKERFMKYIQITLSVPGSSGLSGESLLARVRIDDDDFLQDECVGLS